MKPSPENANEPIITAAAKDKSGLDDSYRMIRLLGRGTMSSVYLAEQLSMARLVALKILSPALALDPAFVERFLREAKASARFSHPNIVAAIDFGEVDNRYFLAMEYVEGETLAELIAREAPLAEARVTAIGHQVILALEHAAEHNVIHRDVKPANIMIRRDGRVKLTDFGLAILLDNPGMAESSRKAVGTPYYMAPEQLEGGAIDWRADQCSLGASLYEAATGAKPFSGKSVSDVLARRLFETPLPAWRANRRVSRSFSSVLGKMLARSPDDRYQSFADLKRDFDRVAAGRKPELARPSGHTLVTRRSLVPGRQRGTTSVRSKVDVFTGNRRWNIVLTALIAIILALGGYAFMHREELAGPRPDVAPDPDSPALERQVSFERYRKMRDAWSEALLLRMQARQRPSGAAYAAAMTAMHDLTQRPNFAGTVYSLMAAESLKQLRQEAANLSSVPPAPPE